MEAVTELNRRIHIPICMKEVVKDEQLFIEELEKLTDKAMSDVATPFNPISPTREEMQNLILKVYYGE